ncbi:MAG: site-specific integrase, partial [Muribaculaceae bacterium]|nr:site-specific integrase [Muribaculaceae bacterium]
MATVKVKYRPSTTVDKEGTIYYQVIHARRPRQISTDYHVFRSEWNDQRSTVTCDPGSNRAAFILAVKERIRADLERISRIIQQLERTRLEYSSEDIVTEYERLLEENSMFSFMEGIIVKLKYN